MTDMRASLTVTADASSVVLEARRAAEAWRELRREAGGSITPSRPAAAPIDPTAVLRREMAEQTARANRALEASISPLVAAERELAQQQQVTTRVLAERVSATKSAEASAQVFAASLDQEERALRGLEASLDPGLRAMREFEAAQRQITSAVQSGTASEAEAARMLDQLTARYDAFVAAQSRAPSSGAARASASVFEASFADEDFAREQAEAAARAFRMLEEGMNPVIRAQRELADAREIVSSAQQAGITTDAQASRALGELERRYEAVVRAQSPAAQSAAAFDRALDEEERSVRQLMLALDPAARAAAEFERAQDQVARAVRYGMITQEDATRTLKLLEAQQQAVGRSGVTMGMGIQNASFQITDFIVQVQSGQSASVALAQQLPQLLGGFGALGAVIGLAVALGVPLASMLFGSADAAGSLDDRLQKLEASLGNVSDHLKTLRDESASEIFGNMAGDVKQLTADLLQLDRVAELKNLRQTLDALLTQKIKPGVLQSAWEGLKAGYNTGPIYTPGQIAALQDRVSRENYADLTGGRGPGFDEFESRRSEIEALAKAGEVKAVIREVNALIQDFAAGGPLTDVNDQLLTMLTTLGKTARQTAEVEAEFNGSANAAQVWAGIVENATGIWERVKEDGAAIKADGEERIRIAENELALAQVVAQFGAESAEAESERDRIAREGYALELERAGIYGEQRDRLVEIWDQHNAVADATAAWADTMAGVRGEIEGILSAIASLGGGMVDRAAKAAELKALNAGATIKAAAAAGQATRREAEFNQRSAALGGGLFGNAVAGVQRWWDEGGDALDADLNDARGEARKRDRVSGGGAGAGGSGVGFAASIKDEIARLKPSYEADLEAAEAWRDKALAGLKKAGAGYADFAADVELIFQEKLAKAYEADLARRDDWAAGVERAGLKMTEDMLSWADVSENIVTSWAKSGEEAFVNFARTGKANIGDLVDFAAEQFARLAYQQMIQPGLNSIMNLATGAIGGALGITMPTFGATAVPTNHTGSPGVMRSYALAGMGDSMRSDERLTMMRRGEEIMTSRALENAGALISAMTSLAAASAQPAQIDARPVILPINNASVPLQMEVQETTDSKGQRQFELVMSDAVTTGLRAKGGSARRTLKSDFGIQRRGPKR